MNTSEHYAPSIPSSYCIENGIIIQSGELLPRCSYSKARFSNESSFRKGNNEQFEVYSQ